MPVVVVENLYARTEHTTIADSNLLMGADHAIAVEIASFPDFKHPFPVYFQITVRRKVTIPSDFQDSPVKEPECAAG